MDEYSVNSYLLMTLKNVRVFEVFKEKREVRLLKEGDLSVISFIFEDSTYTMLALDDFQYPLFRNLPILADIRPEGVHSQYALPGIKGTFYSILIQSKPEKHFLEGFNGILNESCHFQVRNTSQLAMTQSLINQHSPLTQSAYGKEYDALPPVETPSEGSPAPNQERERVKALVYEGIIENSETSSMEACLKSSNKNSKTEEEQKYSKYIKAKDVLSSTGTVVKKGLKGLGSLGAKGINKTSEWYKKKYVKETKEVEISDKTIRGAKLVSEGSTKVYKFSNKAIKGVFHFGAEVIEDLVPKGSADKVRNIPGYKPAKMVGTGVLNLGIQVYEGLTEALDEVVFSFGRNTQEVVQLKYGEKAGELGKHAVQTGYNLYLFDRIWDDSIKEFVCEKGKDIIEKEKKTKINETA